MIVYPNQAVFVEANRERARRAGGAMVEVAKAALPNARTARAREILELRIAHPEATIAELAELHEPALTKGQVAGVLSRAKKRAELAAAIRVVRHSDRI